MGHDDATMLMEHLPPVGWADVATKRDVERIERSLRGDVEHVERSLRTELTVLRSEIREEIALRERHLLTTIVLSMLTANATLVGLVLAAVRIG